MLLIKVSVQLMRLSDDMGSHVKGSTVRAAQGFDVAETTASARERKDKMTKTSFWGRMC
jgi:hypothetical protein